MNYYQLEREEAVKSLKSDSEKGLTQQQAEESRSTCGWNELKQEKKESTLMKFLRQFTDPLILILIAAAVISIAVDPSEWLDSLIICVVVILNAVLGVYQENNAEKSLEALKKMSAPNAKVIRNGMIQSIPSRELVVGDIVELEAGDFVPSDGRILASYNLQIDESALTGESLPVSKVSSAITEKDVSLADRRNMAYATTICTYGRGRMLVTSVGMENEVGKIAGMLMESEDQTTPLQNRLAQISKVIGVLCLGICGVVFFLEYSSGMDMLEAFKTAVALAVAAIPEGLATVVTIVLSLGVTRMAKNNAIVRRLPAVETLGSASVVCSDKTGTLTQNKMTAVKVYTPEYGLQNFTRECGEEVRAMLKMFTLCTDAEVKEADGRKVLIGDPTETAMVEASLLMGDQKEDLTRENPRTNEIAFDSVRKMMTVFCTTPDGIYSFTKGAPDQVLARCVNPPEGAAAVNEQMASEALRVLAVAYRKWDAVPVMLDAEQIETGMTFGGLIGMIDPPREEARTAIAQAHEGGIRTVMITGDHITTASAIARQLGILTEGERAVTGAELDQMSDQQLDDSIEQIAVYARVAPEHKVRIVKAWQDRGNIVAMTGDGVNDSPSLKAADIGCAMGITGTDVAKNAADMILTDDNFATIIRAVREGRGIYDNIRKDVQFLLSSNIGEVLAIFGASLIGLAGYNVGVPLMPVHLLWINLITDTLPAFAIGMEPTDENIMKRSPRSKDENFFAGGLGIDICWQGILIGGLTLISYLIGNGDTHEIGMTMAFLTMSTSELFHSFSVKSTEHSVFSRDLFSNKYLWISFGVGMFLQFLILYTPKVHDIFKLASLDPRHLLIALGLAFVPVLAVDLSKRLRRRAA